MELLQNLIEKIRKMWNCFCKIIRKTASYILEL